MSLFQEEKRLRKVHLPPQAVIDVILPHGAEHKADIQRFSTVLCKQRFSLAAAARGHNDQIGATKDLFGIVVGCDAINRLQGVFNRNRADERPHPLGHVVFVDFVDVLSGEFD